MHVSKAIEELLDILLDLLNREPRVVLLKLFDDIFETLIAELKFSVLADSLIVVHSVEEVKQLNNVWHALQLCQNLILS